MQNSELEDLLETLKDASDEDKTSVSQIMDAVGHRSFGPLLFVIGLIAVSPVGAIPGASLFLAALAILIAGQMIWGAAHIWIPDQIENRSVSSSRLRDGIEKIRPALSYVGTVIKPRLQYVLQNPMPKVAAALAILLALSMVPLVIIPGGVVPAAIAMMLLGLALTSRDGLLFILSAVISLGAGLATIFLVA